MSDLEDDLKEFQRYQTLVAVRILLNCTSVLVFVLIVYLVVRIF